MTDRLTPDEIAKAARQGAEAILRASGSRLDHYETRAKQDILGKAMDLAEMSYRAGAAHARQHLSDAELIAEVDRRGGIFNMIERTKG